MKNFSINWKTTGSGVGVIVTAVVAMWQSKSISSEGITAIFAGLGLIFAKDGNVTGGSSPQ
jgi:uncharacterized membrane protein YgaE (UPF0421/DUF939 family)